MSETKDVRDEPWFKNVPEWMGEVVVRITEARDAATSLMRELSARDDAITNREDIAAEKEQALASAISNVTDFANKLYGPESAIAQINSKLDSIERRITDDRSKMDERFTGIERRLDVLERARKTA